MRLGEYLVAAARDPWIWGGADCCTFAADWVANSGRPDPMAFIRGQYRTERSALLKIKRGGGLVELWSRGATDAGLRETNDPVLGDIAVIARATECGANQAAAIWTGERWVSRGISGLQFGPAEILHAWRV